MHTRDQSVDGGHELCIRRTVEHRSVISDAMRVATGVPTQASQERQRAGYDAQAAAAPPPAPPKP